MQPPQDLPSQLSFLLAGPPSRAAQRRLGFPTDLDSLLAGPPIRAAQHSLLALLAKALEPIRRANRLPHYVLRPGARLKRSYGHCRHFRDAARPPEVLVRCTADRDPTRWRRPGAMVATLVHELAHLRYRSHGPRFWTLHRRLLDQAAAAGIYDPHLDDPAEGARGDEKLAGSAADALAQAARDRRRAAADANRAAAQQWAAGMEARLGLARGFLAGAQVRVVSVGRGRITVHAPNGLHYRVAATLLQPL